MNIIQSCEVTGEYSGGRILTKVYNSGDTVVFRINSDFFTGVIEEFTSEDSGVQMVSVKNIKHIAKNIFGVELFTKIREFEPEHTFFMPMDLIWDKIEEG